MFVLFCSEKEPQNNVEPEPIPVQTISPKEERISEPERSSPVLRGKEKSKTNLKKSDDEKLVEKKQKPTSEEQTEDVAQENKDSNSKQQKASKIPRQNSNDKKKNKSKKDKQQENIANEDIALDATKIIANDNINITMTINKDMNTTVVLPSSVYDHAPFTPTNIVSIF